MNQVNSVPKSNGMALASMILGIVGFFFGWVTFAIVPILAVVLGHKSLRKIKQSNGSETGEGMAITGLITGYISLVFSLIFLLGVIAAITIPAYTDYTTRARVDKGSAAVLHHKRVIASELEKGVSPGTLSTNPSDLGLKAPNQYGTAIVKSIRYDANGAITLTFRRKSNMGLASGRTIVYVPDIIAGKVSWRIDRTRSTISYRFLPKKP